MIGPVNKELVSSLQATLFQLNKLADQIRDTRDYSEQAEQILCLRELILEQIGATYSEDSRHTTHSAR
jgi:hypothetical protein